MIIKSNKKFRKELERLLVKIKDEKLMDAFLVDLFTPEEYEDIIIRLQIVKQLARGVPQRTIAKNLKVSIAKITRGSREMLDKKGGFSRVLDKYYEAEK